MSKRSAGLSMSCGMYTSAHAGHSPNLGHHIQCHAITRVLICPRYLNINRRLHAHVQNRIHQAAGGKERGQLRHFTVEPRFHAIDVFKAARVVPRLEIHLNERRMHSGVSRVNRRKPWIYTNIRNNHSQIVGTHHLVNDVLHPRDLLFRFR